MPLFAVSVWRWGCSITLRTGRRLRVLESRGRRLWRRQKGERDDDRDNRDSSADPRPLAGPGDAVRAERRLGRLLVHVVPHAQQRDAEEHEREEQSGTEGYRG